MADSSASSLAGAGNLTCPRLDGIGVAKRAVINFRRCQVGNRAIIDIRRRQVPDRAVIDVRRRQVANRAVVGVADVSIVARKP